MRQLEGVTGEERRKLKKKLKMRRRKQQQKGGNAAMGGAGGAVIAPVPEPTGAAKYVLECAAGSSVDSAVTVKVADKCYVAGPDGGIAFFDTENDAFVYAQLRSLIHVSDAAAQTATPPNAASQVSDAAATSSSVTVSGVDSPPRDTLDANGALLPPVSPVDITQSSAQAQQAQGGSNAVAACSVDVTPIKIGDAPVPAPAVAAVALSHQQFIDLACKWRLTSMYDFPGCCFTTFAHATQTLALNVINTAAPAASSASVSSPRVQSFQLTSVNPESFKYPPTTFAARLAFAAPVADLIAAFGRPLIGPVDGPAEWCLCVQRNEDEDAGDDGSEMSGDVAGAQPAAKLSKSAKRRAAKKKAKAKAKLVESLQEGAESGLDSAMYAVRGQGLDADNLASSLRLSVLLGPDALVGQDVAIWSVKFDVRQIVAVIESLESMLPNVRFTAIPTLSLNELPPSAPALKGCGPVSALLSSLRKHTLLPLAVKPDPATAPRAAGQLFDGSALLFGMPLLPGVLTDVHSMCATFASESPVFRAVHASAALGESNIASFPPAQLTSISSTTTSIAFRPIEQRLACVGIVVAADDSKSSSAAAAADLRALSAKLRALDLATVLPVAAFEYIARPPIVTLPATLPPSTPTRGEIAQGKSSSPKKPGVWCLTLGLFAVLPWLLCNCASVLTTSLLSSQLTQMLMLRRMKTTA